MLDTGDSSSTQVEPQESEEETDGKNCNFYERMAYIPLHQQLCSLQVQTHSPDDSAVISGLENEEPRDEGGVSRTMNNLHTHVHTSFINTWYHACT